VENEKLLVERSFFSESYSYSFIIIYLFCDSSPHNLICRSYNSASCSVISVILSSTIFVTFACGFQIKNDKIINEVIKMSGSFFFVYECCCLRLGCVL
jgi:hypothetical protein